jgi:hypothetical protein
LECGKAAALEERHHMETQSDAPLYRVWGVDNVAYGPVELPTLVSWIKAERVLADSWLFQHDTGQWSKAGDLPELKPLFGKKAPARQPGETTPNEVIAPGLLRRIKIFAGMDEAQLQSFVNYMEVQRFKQFSSVVRKGDHGDAMYLILEGELRAFTLIGEKETTLNTLSIGDFFGEISLLDQGPRSASVSANTDSVLLRISAPSFDKLVREAPALATLFLYSLSRSIVGRVRGLTRKYEDSIHWSRTAGGV